MTYDWLDEKTRSGTIIIPMHIIYEMGYRSIEEYIEKVFGKKALTYEEQYLNDDGSERDYPKDMKNDYIMHFEGDSLFLVPDNLYCNKFPSTDLGEEEG